MKESEQGGRGSGGELGRAVWGEGAEESRRDGERGRCELGFVSPSLFLRNVNKVVLLPIWVFYSKPNRVSTGGVTKISGTLFRRPLNTTYARFCIRPTPPALYLVVSAHVA